jgi:hypothetical protein
MMSNPPSVRGTVARAFAGLMLVTAAQGCMPGRVPVTTHPEMTTPAMTEPSTTEPSTTGPATIGQATTERATTEAALTGPAVTEPTTGPMAEPTTTAAIEPTTAPTTMPVAIGSTTMPVATADLGNAPPIKGLFPKKPFIKTDPHFGDRGNPSTLLLEHASPDSPVPLSAFSDQPVRKLPDFHLNSGMTADEVQKKFGPPAALADVEDPWFVYRLTNTRELWLHFEPALHGKLVAADVIRGAESGYVRTHVFTAN